MIGVALDDPVSASLAADELVDVVLGTRARRWCNANMNWTHYITVDTAVCHGKACIKGTRVMVSVILDNLASGRTVSQILEDYPSVSEPAVRAAIAYAADLSHERLLVVPVAVPA